METQVLKQKTVSYFRWILAIVITLTLLGLIFIFSSSSIYAAEKFGSSSYFLKKQLFFLGISLIGFTLAALIPLSLIKRLTPYLFFATIAGLMLTIFSSMSVKIHGSHRWLSFAGMSGQPSEFLKVTLFMYIGLLLERKRSTLSSFMRTYIPLLGIVGVSIVLLLKQPDFGMSVTIFATALMVLFVAGVRYVHLFATIACALPIVAAIIIFASYRLHRILIFLNPWIDPQGRGYQIIQSLIAIGSGGMWGVGIAHSRQKFFYLPMQHTDFIFSIIAEETGYVGSLLVLSCYVAFCFLGLKLVATFKNSFAFFTAFGFIVLISLQAAFNFMVVTGLVPTKGLGLPFISYGGSALMCNFCMIGLIANFVRNEAV